jgi:cytochrome c-type biogenesis protein CcmH/NrfF
VREQTELQEEIETYEYQSYQELIEEIQCIKQSNEYVQEAGKDPAHYLRIQIAEMESRAPKLKRFEKLQ